MLKKSAIVAGFAAFSMAIAPVASAAPSKHAPVKQSVSSARAATPVTNAQRDEGHDEGGFLGGNVLWLVFALAGIGGIIYAATKKSSP